MPEEHESAPVVSESTPSIHRQGILALVLIFIASTGFTFVYFQELPTHAPQNVAAAALPDPFDTISIIAESAYVLDLKTGRVLFSKNADAQLPLASLTKVALALAVFDSLPAQAVTIPPHNTPDGAPIRLPEGWQFEPRDLVDFTLVASSNEGAEILADAAAARIRSDYPEANPRAPALWRMNDIAQHLGLGHTYFLNVTGLDVSVTQAGAYGSAHDMALLFGYAASTSPEVFELTTKDTLTIYALSGQQVTANNTDEALPSIPGLVLGKTGYTDLAGGNLAVVFEAGPTHPIAAVVLKSTADGRFEDMKKLVATAQKAIAAGH